MRIIKFAGALLFFIMIPLGVVLYPIWNGIKTGYEFGRAIWGDE